MKKFLSVLIMCICLLAGCAKTEGSKVEEDVKTSIDWTGDKVTVEGSLPDMSISEVIKSEEAKDEDKVTNTKEELNYTKESIRTEEEVNTEEGEEEELNSFDYFVFVYYIVSPVTVTADTTYLTEAYVKEETEKGITYTYKQEADEYGVTEIGYEFNKDNTRSSYVLFDTTNIDTKLVTEKMREMMSTDEAKEYGATFTETENGFECTDILGLATALQYNMEATLDSKIILTINEDSTMRLDIRPDVKEVESSEEESKAEN